MAGTHPATSTQHQSSVKVKTEVATQQHLGSPIGFIQSCFKSKNGTPRQPSICAFSRAKLRVLKEVFPNPEHSIQGLGQFSHVWILFVFHKNGGGKFTKAKVKPPRLDGAKIGVFATRSPHRPNPIGLTLAKLDRIEGDTLHLSGVDIIDGTPVLDVKPYVPSYDNPDCIQHDRTPSADLHSGPSPITCTGKSTGSSDQMSSECGTDLLNRNKHHISVTTSCEVAQIDRLVQCCNENSQNLPNIAETSSVGENENQQFWIKDTVGNSVIGQEPRGNGNASAATDGRKVQGQYLTTAFNKDPKNLATQIDSSSQNRSNSCVKSPINTRSETNEQTNSAGDTTNSSLSGKSDVEYSHGSKVGVADWIQCPPIKTLGVRFTAHAQADLEEFKKESSDPNYNLEFLLDQQEAKQAICKILEADPRSTYRRNSCQDRLYFFMVDTLHITCWFGADFVEVVRVQHVRYADIP